MKRGGVAVLVLVVGVGAKPLDLALCLKSVTLERNGQISAHLRLEWHPLILFCIGPKVKNNRRLRKG